MRLTHFVSTLITLFLFSACSKEKLDENLISYSFLGKDWVAKKSEINVEFFENVLIVNIYSENTSNPSIRGNTSFAIHNPSLGNFDLTKDSKHSFEYVHLTDLPSLVDFTLADQNGSITITELDFNNKTISFQLQASLSSEDVKNQPINVRIERAPMKVKFKKVSYLRYSTEKFGSDSFIFDIDSIRINKVGNFSLFTFRSYLNCNFSNTISLKTYTQDDESPYFGFGNSYFSNQSAQEYEITFGKADDNGINATFEASIFYPNFGERITYSNGYFEMFTEN